MDEALVRKDLWDEPANGFLTVFTRVVAEVFGPGVNRPAIGPITWADLAVAGGVVLLILAAHGLAALFVHRKEKSAEAAATKESLWHQFFRALGGPIYSLIWVGGSYVALATILRKLLPVEEMAVGHRDLSKLVDLAVFAVLLWLFIRLTRVLDAWLAAWASKTGSKLDELFVPLAGKALRIIVPVVGVILALPVLGLAPEYAGVVSKGTSILLIVAVALILFQAVHLGENVVLLKFNISVADNLRARKIHTQVQVIGRVLYVVIALFSVASILMLFEELRHLGTSMLASAGVVGVILGFAAQKTIANLFAGFQVALAQPIRLDDVVVVGESWGRIEEITLTYVVVHVWDDTRLIVPLSDFIEKQFQNWTRATANILGSVILWVDYSLPVEEVRNAVRQIIETNPLWDRRFWNLQVSDASEHTMQIRVLCTAADSSIAWNLRCDVREKLIAFIQQNHPQSLPRLRADLEPPKLGGASQAH
jgi:small-conductance mechanosensitive channel